MDVLVGDDLGRVHFVKNLAGATARNDFNGDGKSDILWRNSTSGGTSLWFVNGLSTVGSVSFGVVPGVWSVATTGTYNGDGAADIVWRNQSTGKANIWFMDGGAVVSNGNLGIIGTEFSIVP